MSEAQSIVGKYLVNVESLRKQLAEAEARNQAVLTAAKMLEGLSPKAIAAALSVEFGGQVEATPEPVSRQRAPKVATDKVAEATINNLDREGKTTAQLAKESGFTVAQVGRVCREMLKEGKIKKTGREWFLP